MKRYRIFLKVDRKFEHFNGVYFETDDLEESITEFNRLSKICDLFCNGELKQKTLAMYISGPGITATSVDAFDLETNDPYIYEVGDTYALCALNIDGKTGMIQDDTIYIDDIPVGKYDYSMPTVNAILNYLE